MELNGVWRVAAATDDLRRTALRPDADDATWPEIAVPGHWRDHPDFADHDGPLLYRRRYRLAPPDDGRRRWITFEGIFYQADVWLDGAYLGDAEGYFLHHTFDITALSRIGDEHVVATEVACPPQPGPRQRRTITGIYQNWDGIDRGWNPGGLWRSVRIDDTGPVRIAGLKVLCRDADDTRAHVVLSTRLDTDRARTVTVTTSVDGDMLYSAEHRLARGTNEVNWSLDIADPRLWWPRGLGDQLLTSICVEVVVNGEVSDRAIRRTGLRVVAWNNWSCSVNGERLFLKGANLLPTRLSIADATDAELRRDVELAVEAGLDAVRVHAHIAPDAIYDAADEAGVLVLQDFPLQWGYARSVRAQAVTQADAMVWQLAHHPSIVQWNAHNDPAAVAVGLEGPTNSARARYLAAHQLPTWNKSVLDRWVRRAIERADPTRLAVAHSGVLPHLPMLDGTDSHFYFGWYHGESDDLRRLARAAPRTVRFLSEFGAQAVPESADFIDPTLWPDLDWEHLEHRYGLQKSVFDHRVPPDEYDSFARWRTATQRYQADLIRDHIELLRRLKYHPAGGFCVFALNDPAPAVSWSVLDDRRVPKAGWEALVDACRPVIVTASPVPRFVTAGERIRLDLHVVSDRREPIDSAVLRATMSWIGGERRWAFGGEFDADSVVRAGRIELDVPAALGALSLDLELSFGTETVRNRYATAITLT